MTLAEWESFKEEEKEGSAEEGHEDEKRRALRKLLNKPMKENCQWEKDFQ